MIAWLRSPEGEEWSRSRAPAGGPAYIDLDAMTTQWRAKGPLDLASDPCGWTAAS